MNYSHNDYRNEIPFYSGVKKNIEVFEVDVLAHGFEVLVAHEWYPLRCMYCGTLESLYLLPMTRHFFETKIKPKLIIDFKTSSRKLHKYLYRLMKIYDNIDYYITAGDNWFTKIFGSRKKSVHEFLMKYCDELNIKNKSCLEHLLKPI